MMMNRGSIQLFVSSEYVFLFLFQDRLFFFVENETRNEWNEMETCWWPKTGIWWELLTVCYRGRARGVQSCKRTFMPTFGNTRLRRKYVRREREVGSSVSMSFVHIRLVSTLTTIYNTVKRRTFTSAKWHSRAAATSGAPAASRFSPW